MNFQTLNINSACHLTVSDRFPNSNISDGKMLTGFDGRNRFRSYLYFDLGGLPQDAAVSFAALRIYTNRISTRVPSAVLYVFPLLSGFNGDTTYQNQPRCGRAAAGLLVERCFQGWMDFNITHTVCGWVSGSQENYGVLLLPEQERPAIFDIVAPPQYGENYLPQLVVCFSAPGCKPVYRTVRSSIIDTREEDWNFTFRGVQYSPAVSAQRVHEATYFVTNTGGQPVTALVQTSADRANWVDDPAKTVQAGQTEALAVKYYGKYYRVKLESLQLAKVQLRLISQNFN